MSKEVDVANCKKCGTSFTYNPKEVEGSSLKCLRCGKEVNIYA